jgi:hypothetical protein
LVLLPTKEEVGGKSKGITISIWIGSTESTNQKAGILVIGKNDLTIDNGVFEGGDFETKAIYSVEITAIREDLGLVAKKTITVEIYDLDDEPPTVVI